MKRLITLAAVLCLITGMAFSACAAGGQELKVSLPETVKGYTPCVIGIESPAAGEAELRLLDANNNLWLTTYAHLSSGKNAIEWNGLGENLERLFAGPYHFDVTLAAEDGTEYSGTGKFDISGTTPTLVYALPSSETIWLDGSEKWFVEYFTSVENTAVVMEVRRDGKLVCTQESMVASEDGETVDWDGRKKNKKKIEPGDYTLTFYSRKNPEYSFTYPLKAEKGPCPVYGIEPTGPIVPERGMTDAEIWEIMMKPSVVIKGKSVFGRYDLYERKGTRSKVAGTLRCATQALEVLENDGRWAHVRAWRHEDGMECTGYIRTDSLTVVQPAAHYGLLIDKREQTMTVYMDGKAIGTLPVSTGKVEGYNTYQATPAGAFLTNYRFGMTFAQNGYRYEYPIRYDAGNIIHSVGYVRVGRVRDYSANLPLLGQKASHGCVRVSPFVTDECEINMYWLWTRLPYHTRVIILDD